MWWRGYRVLGQRTWLSWGRAGDGGARDVWSVFEGWGNNSVLFSV